MINAKDFIIKNHDKGITFMAYVYSFYYRLCVDMIPMKKLHDKMGIEGQESIFEETKENIAYARLVAFHVNRITTHLPWEKTCLVRALTLRRFLKKRGISCTIYLGVMLEDDKMIAHAWLRCGTLYATGGHGEGYATVTKFRT